MSTSAWSRAMTSLRACHTREGAMPANLARHKTGARIVSPLAGLAPGPKCNTSAMARDLRIRRLRGWKTLSNSHVVRRLPCPTNVQLMASPSPLLTLARLQPALRNSRVGSPRERCPRSLSLSRAAPWRKCILLYFASDSRFYEPSRDREGEREGEIDLSQVGATWPRAGKSACLSGRGAP